MRPFPPLAAADSRDLRRPDACLLKRFLNCLFVPSQGADRPPLRHRVIAQLASKGILLRSRHLNIRHFPDQVCIILHMHRL